MEAQAVLLGDDLEARRDAVHRRLFVMLALRKAGLAGLATYRAAECFGPLIHPDKCFGAAMVSKVSGPKMLGAIPDKT